jgi:hypothetical protein
VVVAVVMLLLTEHLQQVVVAVQVLVATVLDQQVLRLMDCQQQQIQVQVVVAVVLTQPTTVVQVVQV